jgi:DNA modification methylase
MKIINADCIAAMSEMSENSVDSIVTDPPYELGFMGKSWDSTGIAFNIEIWKEALRVLKPGGHLIAFGGSRTYHRMAVAIEDAGFQIRDQIMWVYGSGFPKSHNIGKKIEGWDGWGTALKPAHEPIVLARKQIVGTVANNVLQFGTGGLNIDGSRVGSKRDSEQKQSAYSGSNVAIVGQREGGKIYPENLGRFPANFIHDGSDEVLELLNEAARFFYCAKASKRDRNEGALNHHPTVKPTSLMQYLVRLVTPPNGIVLDPFMGSGSTGKACVLEGFDFIGIEQSAEYVEIARARIEYANDKRSINEDDK